MNENNRLQKLLKDHFDGSPWIDVQIMQTLKDVKAKEAARNIYGFNSIWQIVHHISCWRETLLHRLQGEKIPAPAHNYFVPVADASPEAWIAVLNQLIQTQTKLLDYLNSPINWDEQPENSTYTRYELVQGVLQHDAYHLGQIILIKKLLLT